MHPKLAPVLALCVCTSLARGAFTPVFSAETREEVLQALRATELPNGPMDELKDEELAEVALKAKTVEAKRDVYARALELYMERIGAGKDVDQALIDYERAEIALAAEWKATRKVLEVIKKQDKLAHEWKHHRTLHPELHTAEHVDHHHGVPHALEHNSSDSHPADSDKAEGTNHSSHTEKNNAAESVNHASQPDNNAAGNANHGSQPNHENTVENADHHSLNAPSHQDRPQANTGLKDM
ncbi:MAG TPA: hypothetical protein V6C89_09870 [Drouetiella sp.]|jgi:hypothetical protein